MRILFVLGISLLLLVGVAFPALAGTEPSPWQPQINQLNAVVNALEAVDRELTAVLGTPPDPFIPGTNGIIGQLDAMTNQLEVQLRRVQAVLAAPPDPFNALREPLVTVRSVASRIYERAGVDPSPFHDLPGVPEALEGVQQAAQNIMIATGPYS